MKKSYTFLLSLILLIGICNTANAQTLVVSGSLFIPQDSISFTYSSPAFSSTDWIGIYRIAEAPGGPPSVAWDYIPAASGTFKLKAPNEAGIFKAYLLCCDGYDIIATSAEFSVNIPVLTSDFATYVQGTPMVFSYVSPRFSSTDWIGIYPTGTKPGDANPSIDWDYIPDSSGTMTFNTSLSPGMYDAYLLCCDGYDSLAACTFEVKNANTAFITPKTAKFAAGSPIDLIYNDPSFATNDWIGIYFEGDDPALVTSVAWNYLTTKSGTLSFPGTLGGGTYFAVMFCCNGSENEYARSASFTVEAGAVGTYIKTVASVYPLGVKVLVNYRDNDFVDTDWIGIYNKGEAPGGPDATQWKYAPSDSSTVEFTDPLPTGEYVVYLLCCDGYNIKAKYSFKIADASTPSLVATAMTYAAGDSLAFYYNSPGFVSTDWIGIYHPGDVPGEINSITWQYIPVANGSMIFHYPDDQDLAPGEYWAGLFCCDGYDMYAQTSFVVTESVNTAIRELDRANKVSISPNPSHGLVNIEMANNEQLQRIKIYSLTGQVLYQEKPDGSANKKTIDLKSLNEGVYFIEVSTGKSLITKKLIIQ
jgi:hypothetical protein